MNKLTFEKTKGAFTKAKIYHYYELPVKQLSEQAQQPIVNIVSKIMVNASKNISYDLLEKQLNIIVYKTYELTYDEILIVDPETSITREEYEKRINIKP